MEKQCLSFQTVILSLLCVSILYLPFLPPAKTNDRINERPIIGVLAQEVHFPKPNRTTYIAASYVKFLESAGARVVPVLVDLPEEDYGRIFSSINGYAEHRCFNNPENISDKHIQPSHITNTDELLLTFDIPVSHTVEKKGTSTVAIRTTGILYPGGGADIHSSGYQRAAKIFYDLAIAANQKGDYFPVWGTCLGFEQLVYLTSKDAKLSSTNTSGVPLPLNFTNDARHSRMFQGFPAALLDALASEPLTVNAHKWSLAAETFHTDDELKAFYKVLSLNTDGETEFISTVEAHNYPIYGTQWHPEKNAFEWNQDYIPHSSTAVRVTFYMADFFVSEARKNFHRFQNEDDETKSLIYNYNPVYSGPKGSFEQIYVF